MLLKRAVRPDPRRGDASLKALVTEAINERLRSLRRRHAEFAADPGYLLDALAAGNTVANDLADATLNQLRQQMHMHYQPVG